MIHTLALKNHLWVFYIDVFDYLNLFYCKAHWEIIILSLHLFSGVSLLLWLQPLVKEDESFYLIVIFLQKEISLL